MENIKNKSICAIICELNPLHNGHKYLFEKAKNLSGCDYLIGIMSANFVQRGEPAIFDCSIRTKMALESGLDAVIYLPTEYCTASAEIFCKAGVEIINSIKNVTHLAFGVEKIDIEQLQVISKILIKNDTQLNNEIKSNLNNGVSYSQAKQNAITKILSKNQIFNDDLFAPNNILALEYLLNLNENITPLAIKRINHKNITSASTIRNLLICGKKRKALKFIPKELHKYYKNKIFDYEKFKAFALCNLSLKTKNELANYRDINEGMENLFYDKINECNNYDDFLNTVVNKRYTKNRINRAILSSVLEFQKINIQNIKIEDLKLAGVKGDILKYLQCNKNLISRVNELKKNIYNDLDEKAERIYNKFNNKTFSSFWLDKLIKFD